jgi:hypothetical protein
VNRRGFVRATMAGPLGVFVGRGAARAQHDAAPARLVLEGVPRIGFANAECGGGLFFPSALAAWLRFMGEDPGYDYTFCAATSGAAFGLLWGKEPWTYVSDLTDQAVNGGDEETVRRPFDAIGYECKLLRRTGPDSEGSLRRRIVESLREGRPVLATGVVGPPACGVIAGYDDGGDVLIGWSYFQSYPGHGPATEFEPCGYYRKRGWFPDTGTVIVIGEKRDTPALGAVYRETLRWALDLVRSPERLGCHSGLAAYTAWAEALSREEDFPRDDLEALLGRLDCHFGALGAAAEGRHHAAAFVRRAGEQQAALAKLDQAAECYDDQVALLTRVADLQGGWDPHDESVARKLAEPEIRRKIVSLILQAREKDRQAAEHIEGALAQG